jgi:hypothetical protein
MVRHRLGAERVDQREEHRSRMPQGPFDVGLLALASRTRNSSISNASPSVSV